MKNLGTASRVRGPPVRAAEGLAGLRGWPCLLTPVDEHLSPCHRDPVGQRVRGNQLACCWRFPVRGLGGVLVDRRGPGSDGEKPSREGQQEAGRLWPRRAGFPRSRQLTDPDGVSVSCWRRCWRESSSRLGIEGVTPGVA